MILEQREVNDTIRVNVLDALIKDLRSFAITNCHKIKILTFTTRNNENIALTNCNCTMKTEKTPLGLFFHFFPRC